MVTDRRYGWEHLVGEECLLRKNPFALPFFFFFYWIPKFNDNIFNENHEGQANNNPLYWGFCCNFQLLMIVHLMRIMEGKLLMIHYMFLINMDQLEKKILNQLNNGRNMKYMKKCTRCKKICITFCSVVELV